MMNIQFTDAAVQQLKPRLEQERLQLKLLYDTEGCGCVVSGVPALQFLHTAGEDDVAGSGQPLPFLYEPRFEIFFEEQLKIDYDAKRAAFSLKSDSQIYTNHLRVIG